MTWHVETGSQLFWNSLMWKLFFCQTRFHFLTNLFFKKNCTAVDTCFRGPKWKIHENVQMKISEQINHFGVFRTVENWFQIFRKHLVIVVVTEKNCYRFNVRLLYHNNRFVFCLEERNAVRKSALDFQWWTKQNTQFAKAIFSCFYCTTFLVFPPRTLIVFHCSFAFKLHAVNLASAQIWVQFSIEVCRVQFKSFAAAIAYIFFRRCSVEAKYFNVAIDHWPASSQRSLHSNGPYDR